MQKSTEGISERKIIPNKDPIKIKIKKKNKVMFPLYK